MTERVFWLLLAICVVLLAVMSLASPKACGSVWLLCTFDAPHWPYGADKARAYLAALNAEARWRYAWVVQPLDLLLPVLLCIWLRAAAARWTVTAAVRLLRRLAVLYAAVDYLENAAIRVMLAQPAGDFPDVVAAMTSGLTTIKWLSLLAFALMLAARLDRGGGRQ